MSRRFCLTPSPSASKSHGREHSTLGWQRRSRRVPRPTRAPSGIMAPISAPAGSAPALAAWQARSRKASRPPCRPPKARRQAFPAAVSPAAVEEAEEEEAGNSDSLRLAAARRLHLSVAATIRLLVGQAPFPCMLATGRRKG